MKFVVGKKVDGNGVKLSGIQYLDFIRVCVPYVFDTAFRLALAEYGYHNVRQIETSEIVTIGDGNIRL